MFGFWINSQSATLEHRRTVRGRSAGKIRQASSGRKQPCSVGAFRVPCGEKKESGMGRIANRADDQAQKISDLRETENPNSDKLARFMLTGSNRPKPNTAARLLPSTRLRVRKDLHRSKFFFDFYLPRAAKTTLSSATGKPTSQAAKKVFPNSSGP